MDKKITQLNPSTGIALNELVPVVDDPSGTAETQKATWTQASATVGNAILLHGNGAPVGAPVNATVTAFYLDEAADSLWYWNVTAGAWRQLIA